MPHIEGGPPNDESGEFLGNCGNAVATLASANRKAHAFQSDITIIHHAASPTILRLLSGDGGAAIEIFKRSAIA
jgi:hypothetical protein